MQTEFVFAPGGYAMDLEGELAKALQARTEMLARKRNPKLWRLTDQMQSFAASGPEQRELQRRRIIGYGMTAVLFLAAAALLIFGFTEPRDRRMIAIGGVCALLAVSRVLPFVTTGSSITRYAKAAHQHLTSLRAADFSQKPTIRFTEDKMRVQSNLGGRDYDYDTMEAFVETPRLFVLTHSGAATVLQKQDLVLGTPEEFKDFFLSHAQPLSAELV